MSRCAIITGVGRRFGYQLSEHLLKQGWTVYGLYRSEQSQLVSLRQQGAHLIQCDFTDQASLAAALHKLTEIPSIDLLVQSASVFKKDPPKTTELIQTLSEALEVHLLAPVFLAETLYPALKHAKGQMICLTDIYSQRPEPTFSAYCASKAALQNICLSYAKKWAPEVRVNTISPGPIAFLPDHTEAAKRAVLDSTPLEKTGGFDALIQTVDYLVSNEFVTGSNQVVDGGRLLKI